MLLDARAALGLLAEAVREQGQDPRRPPIVICALRRAGVPEQRLAPLQLLDLRTLWLRAELPAPMTLGALVVLRRAQRAEACGAPWEVVVQRAADAAALVVAVAPDELTARTRACPAVPRPAPPGRRAAGTGRGRVDGAVA